MSVVPETITLDRHHPASLERVFRAFADPAAKARWFRGPEGGDPQGETTFDFRETSAAGGRTHLVLTDQGVYLDGRDSAKARPSGIDAQLALLAEVAGRDQL
ncbi:hypothetical protein [Actinoplanes auranticolor]|uniref:Activator of Hsp90 ATPase-like protein n=1 Tax=Actinoplanes auranticolor TaxID=47988 RepID=A0A919SM80_9ACTN|nr:hypothetical protein [Actinoplanes auranticolor]GIM74181.1 hypothetical protein Aau02nite_59710 [Actinoplanes auranticolor]